jgi:hypothetical protein
MCEGADDRGWMITGTPDLRRFLSEIREEKKPIAAKETKHGYRNSKLICAIQRVTLPKQYHSTMAESTARIGPSSEV